MLLREWLELSGIALNLLDPSCQQLTLKANLIMTMKLYLWSFICLFFLSGCGSPAKDNRHVDDWITVNKFDANNSSGE